MSDLVIETTGLRKEYRSRRGAKHVAVDDLDLAVPVGGVHGFLARTVKDFAADRNSRSQRFYRVINEVPTLLMIGIVILAIVKPWS